MMEPQPPRGVGALVTGGAGGVGPIDQALSGVIPS
jgi:hypothetical protein